MMRSFASKVILESLFQSVVLSNMLKFQPGRTRPPEVMPLLPIFRSSRGKPCHRHRFDGEMIAQMNLFRGEMIDHRKRFDGEMIALLN